MATDFKSKMTGTMNPRTLACRDCQCNTLPFGQTATINATVLSEPDQSRSSTFFDIQREGTQPGCRNPRYAAVSMQTHVNIPKKCQAIRLTGRLCDDGDFQVDNAEDLIIL